MRSMKIKTLPSRRISMSTWGRVRFPRERFDPGPATEIIGVVEFNSHVLAIITSTENLAASDFLANTGVRYLSPSARGLESGDYVRVLTEFSPKRITDGFGEKGTVPYVPAHCFSRNHEIV
jgi:hypothetical protein